MSYDKRAVHFGSKQHHEEKNGILYTTREQMPTLSGTTWLQRVLITKKKNTLIICACHDRVDGQHFGLDKILSKVCEC